MNNLAQISGILVQSAKTMHKYCAYPTCFAQISLIIVRGISGTHKQYAQLLTYAQVVKNAVQNQST